MNPRSTVLRLAVVGGGPSCTYAMERLAATAGTMDDRVSLEIHIFDKTGQFGAGQVHSARQPVTSFLNRIVGQVAFAADESVTDAGPLLPRKLRPTLYEWCRLRFAETADHTFDLAPEDWPKRYVHGMALRSLFERYVELLRAHPRVEVFLHHDEVVDLEEQDGGFRVHTASGSTGNLVVGQVLMVTGHSTNDPAHFPVRREWATFAEHREAVFVPSAYPLEVHLTDEIVTPDRVVGCAGMGLTAIDVILHLTEGRGGKFDEAPDGRLRYLPSGTEPESIVAFGGAGLFTFARPFNAKEKDLTQFEHKGAFLTENAVDRLRESVGTPVPIGELTQRQLDFERHVFPLVVLEMAYLYYTTLLGKEFGSNLADRMWPAYDAFLDDAGGDITGEQATAALLAPLEAAVDEAQDAIDGILDGAVTPSDPRHPSWIDPAYRRFVTVVFGDSAAEPRVSPWRHAPRLAGSRFDWERTIKPIPAAECTTPEDYRLAMIEFMIRDHLWAEQDNLTNPAKAAADGVWRDLRPVLGRTVDFGGLNPRSHRRFLDIYMRHHNRLANGAALEVMAKILALVEHGLVDVSAGPDAEIGCSAEDSAFVVHGPHTGARRRVDVLVDARVHPFDPESDTAPLYPALLRRGLVRKWRNPDVAGGPGFEPGGLDLTAAFHPIRADGRADERITFLGPPSEGVMFFQLGALRPQQNHHVMRDILCWIGNFWQQVDRRVRQDGPLVASTTRARRESHAEA
jgi:hypothetical protein